MKKAVFFLICINILIFQAILSQPVQIRGIVKIATGQPVSGALVKTKPEKKEIFTDSIGAFNFKVIPFSKILISFNGYKMVEFKIRDQPIDTAVILYPETVKNQPDNAFNSTVKAENLETAISSGKGNTTIYGSSLNSGAGTFFPQFSHKEDTKGSRYLFDDWVKGQVMNANGEIINNPDYLFNYDKISGDLLLTQDKKSAIAVDPLQIKSFTLYDKTDSPLVFEIVPSIGGKLFTNVLAAGAMYKLYKLTKTKFIKSDYRTDGMTSTGNPYDEYADDQQYFLLTNSDNKPETFKISKKSIKAVFKNEAPKVNEYFSRHSDEVIDESFIKGLINFLNQTK